MTILGLGGLLNDAACAVIRDGRLVAAVEQKKLARRERRGELPSEAIQAALELAGVKADDVDIVAIARPFSRRADSTLHLELRDRFPASRLVVIEHHLAHAASAYYCSPFDRATVLTLDRSGDFRCGARWQAADGELKLDSEVYYPDSLGELYGRVTEFLGHEPRQEEHKVQWLSVTGAAGEYAAVFEEIFRVRDGEWPRLDRDYIDANGRNPGGFSARFYQRFGLAEGEQPGPAVAPAIAAGLQQAVEKIVLAMAGSGENLCLAGGLMLNALLVAAIERGGRWKRVFVQPAAGNSGTAIGAACAAWRQAGGAGRVPFDTLALGPAYSAEQIKQVLENCKLRFRYLLTTSEVIAAAVEQLDAQRILAWMQGRMEFGPRALGNRSILASPLNPYSSENLNRYIKHREAFRKFAASVPAESAAQYFDVGGNARFLATVGRVKAEFRERFAPAILGDGWIRVHTVDPQENPLFHALLRATGERTGLPVLYNTSFNLFGDPLVCTPRDAVRSFYSSGIDAMLTGNFLLEK